MRAALRKVEQVSEEADHLRQALDKYNTRERRCDVEARRVVPVRAAKLFVPAVQSCNAQGARMDAAIFIGVSAGGRSRKRSAQSCWRAERLAGHLAGDALVQTRKQRSRGTSTTASGSWKRRTKLVQRSSATWRVSESA